MAPFFYKKIRARLVDALKLCGNDGDEVGHWDASQAKR
jgi:hypothetical protein